MADEDEDTLAQSIAEEREGAAGGEAEGGEESGAEAEESEEGAEGEGESEEGSEEQGEEGEAEEAEASGPGDEEESEEEGEEDEGERTQSRGRNRVQRLAEERNRLRAENEELRRRANGGGQGGGGGAAAPQPKTGQEVREAIKANVTKLMDGFEFLSPADRAERLLQAQEQVLNTVMQPLRFSAADQQDRTSFRDRYSNSPLYKRLSGKVEQKYSEARAQGLFIPRETLFKDLIGDETLRQLGKGGGSQRRQAEARRAKAKGASTKGKGDSGKGGGKSRLQSLEERLEGKQI